jgi:biotin operon repressor
MGVVQYHVWALTKAGEVEDCRMGRFRRFFRVGAYKEMERKVISLLRQDTAGRILVLLSDGRAISHVKLANLLGVSSQALSWQMGRLKSRGFVEVQRSAGASKVEYTLTCESLQIVRGLVHDGHESNAIPCTFSQESRNAATVPKLWVEEAPRVKEVSHRFWY